jgi:nucleoside-diphosphate-sugar epimerase
MGARRRAVEGVVMSRVLITGNMGYVGSTLVRHLSQRLPGAELVGLDSGLFAHCLTSSNRLPETVLARQIFADVRDIDLETLRGFDSVVHLAAVSNDPMGDRFAATTMDVNLQSTVRVATLAAEAGVKNFVFASSCSVYGAGGDRSRRETDGVEPLTHYAKSKVESERRLAQIDQKNMKISCLRFATACGMSDRLRLDLVLNDFVATAFVTNRVDVLSDGTPWRPLINVSDMARAIEWAIVRPRETGGDRLVVNVGSDDWNFNIRALAEGVTSSRPGLSMSINEKAAPDKRSYKVDFSLYRQLAPEHQPIATIGGTIDALFDGVGGMGLTGADMKARRYARLQELNRQIEAGWINEQLRPLNGKARNAGD